MEKTIISEGKTTAEAIEKGLKKLNISRDNAEIKVLEEKKKNFFSILDPHIVKVEITVKDIDAVGKAEIKSEIKNEEKSFNNKEISDESLEKAKALLNNFLNELLSKIQEKTTFSIKIEDKIVYVDISGEGSAKLIGYRGEALNSLQTILSNIVNNKIEEQVRVLLDIEGYRSKREKTLEELAVKLEKTVIKNGKSIRLEPMSAYERKIIHTTLQNSKYVKTFSVGEGEHRRIVIGKK